MEKKVLRKEWSRLLDLDYPERMLVKTSVLALVIPLYTAYKSENTSNSFSGCK